MTHDALLQFGLLDSSSVRFLLIESKAQESAVKNSGVVSPCFFVITMLPQKHLSACENKNENIYRSIN